MFAFFPGRRAVARVALKSATATPEGGREGCVLAQVQAPGVIECFSAFFCRCLIGSRNGMPSLHEERHFELLV